MLLPIVLLFDSLLVLGIKVTDYYPLKSESQMVKKRTAFPTLTLRNKARIRIQSAGHSEWHARYHRQELDYHEQLMDYHLREVERHEQYARYHAGQLQMYLEQARDLFGFSVSNARWPPQSYLFRSISTSTTTTTATTTTTTTTTTPPSRNARLIGCENFQCVILKFELLKTRSGFLLTRLTEAEFPSSSTDSCSGAETLDPNFVCWLDSFKINEKGYGFELISNSANSDFDYEDGIFQLGQPRNRSATPLKMSDIFGNYQDY